MCASLLFRTFYSVHSSNKSLTIFFFFLSHSLFSFSMKFPSISQCHHIFRGFVLVFSILNKYFENLFVSHQIHRYEIDLNFFFVFTSHMNRWIHKISHTASRANISILYSATVATNQFINTSVTTHTFTIPKINEHLQPQIWQFIHQ